MRFDTNNPVIALCVAGIAVEGDPSVARPLFLRAWDARSDHYDASIAAHYVARHQATPLARLRWNRLALLHALRIQDSQAAGSMFPSLYLNLADSLLAVGQYHKAREALECAAASLDTLVCDGYKEFLAMGMHRLQGRIDQTSGATRCDVVELTGDN